MAACAGKRTPLDLAGLQLLRTRRARQHAADAASRGRAAHAARFLSGESDRQSQRCEFFGLRSGMLNELPAPEL